MKRPLRVQSNHLAHFADDRYADQAAALFLG